MMPPSMQTDEPRGICRHQIPFVPQPLRKGDASFLPLAKREQLFKRKCLSTENEQRRRVRFSVVKTALLEDTPRASEMDQDEKNLLWWNKQELKEIYDNIATLMRSFSKRPRHNHSTQAYHTVLYRIDEACRDELGGVPNEEELKALSDWHRNSLSRRGLEKLVLNSHETNSKIRATIAHATSLLVNNANIDESIKAESIRVCSERLTKPARAFAKALGDADAACILPAPEKPRIRRAINMLP